MSKKSLVSKLADAVIWIDKEAEKLRSEIKDKTKEFLEFADDSAERLGAEGENELKNIIKELREKLKELEKDLEENYKNMAKKSLEEIDELAKKNFDKATEEVEKNVINILTGGAKN